MRRRSKPRSRAFAGRRGRWELKWLGKAFGLGRCRDQYDSSRSSHNTPRLIRATLSGGRRGNNEESRERTSPRRAKAVEPRPYTLQEAVPLLQKVKFAKFDETVEITMRLGVDPKHADQMVRGTVVLPHGLGKSKKVLVIATGDKITRSRSGGRGFRRRRRDGREDQQRKLDRLRRADRHARHDEVGRTTG